MKYLAFGLFSTAEKNPRGFRLTEDFALAMFPSFYTVYVWETFVAV